MTNRIDQLALLAGLQLDAGEREQLERRLDALQSLIDGLPAVDEEGLQASRAPVLSLRADRSEGGLPVDLALRSAPARSGDWLDSPPALEGRQ